MTATLATPDLSELARFDTPTISNVIELFGVQPQTAGYMDRNIRCCFARSRPMVGYACTATYRSAEPPAAGVPTCEVAHLVEAFPTVPGPAVVVFEDLDDPPAAACFGELACRTYKAFGAVGMVTSGAGRDLDQVEALDFPVFSTSTICSHGYGHLTSVGKPVQIGGITVRPGDLLHGDRNGVVVIPRNIAPHVAGIAAEIMDAEKVVIDYLNHAAPPTVDGYRAVIRDMQDLLEHIRLRLQTL